MWHQVFLFNINNFQTEWTLTGTTTLGQSKPESNVNEGWTSFSPELEPHHQMKFSIISTIYKILYSKHIFQSNFFFFLITDF